VRDVVHELVATERALDKLGGRGIPPDEAAQLPRNRHVAVRNPRDPGRRRFVIGSSDGGRVLTLVVERTMEPTTWLIVTGWDATDAERRILSRGTMTKNPWTDPDPQPGDLDAELALLDESAIEYHEGDPAATLRIVVSIEGADASRLARIAETRGQKPSDVVAELLRDADRPAA
jgi:hypothetical protein